MPKKLNDVVLKGKITFFEEELDALKVVGRGIEKPLKAMVERANEMAVTSMNEDKMIDAKYYASLAAVAKELMYYLSIE